MATYKIYGASADSGEAVVFETQAETIRDAESIASGRRIMVSRMVEVERHQPQLFHPQLVQMSAAPAPESAGERVVWQGHPSQWENLPRYIFAVLFFWLIFPVVLALFAYLRTKSIKYVLTSQRLKIESGLIGKDVEEVELYRVKDSTLFRSPIDRLRGTGTIRLHTSDKSAPLVHLRSVNNPAPLREKIRSLVEARREAKGIREVDYV